MMHLIIKNKRQEINNSTWQCNTVGSELSGSNVLFLHVTFTVDENGGEILVRVVGNAQRRYTLDELGLWEFLGQRV